MSELQHHLQNRTNVTENQRYHWPWSSLETFDAFHGGKGLDSLPSGRMYVVGNSESFFLVLRVRVLTGWGGSGDLEVVDTQNARVPLSIKDFKPRFRAVSAV